MANLFNRSAVSGGIVSPFDRTKLNFLNVGMSDDNKFLPFAISKTTLPSSP